jgi:hypothetical protein
MYSFNLVELHINISSRILALVNIIPIDLWQRDRPLPVLVHNILEPHDNERDDELHLKFCSAGPKARVATYTRSKKRPR